MDLKNTTVAQIFKMLNHQIQTDFDLKTYRFCEEADQKLDLASAAKLTQKEQMEMMMAEVIAKYELSFSLSLKNLREELIIDLK